MSRDSVAIICPFAGAPQDGVEACRRLSRIARATGDELVIVDNTSTSVLARLEVEPGIVVIPAIHEQSSYYARNVGAEATGAEWLLFVDSDCLPSVTILDEYFAEPIPEDCGAVAGAVVGLSSQSSLLGRWARARGVLDQRRLAHKERPFGATANLLVRRRAWADVGGFHEAIRSGGDVDFCWRLQEAGWKLLYRDAALVEHEHRERLRPLLRQYARYGAGRAWLERRYPDEPRSTSRHLVRLAATPVLVLGELLRLRTESAVFRSFDGAIVTASLVGRLLDNRAREPGQGSLRKADVVVFTDEFPTVDVMRTVELLADAGRPAAVESRTRSSGSPLAPARGLDVSYSEDDGALRRLRDIGWLAARRPSAVLGLLGTRNRTIASPARRVARRAAAAVCWLRDDDVAGAAARQVGSLLGVPTEPLDRRG